MARACPACGRPNSDQATRCLYCTEPLAALPSETERPEDLSEAQAPVSERHLIILAPPVVEEAIDAKVPSFAEVMDWTLYEARLALQTRRHRLLRKVEGAEKAAEISRRLDELGLDHFVLAESDVEALPVTSVRWLRFDKESMELGLADKNVCRVAYQDLRLLVRGEIARERHHERRMATPRGASQPLTPGLRLHLFETDATMAAELDAEQFDWSVLGRERSASTPINFKRLIDEIRDRAPGALLDRGFDFEPVVLSHSESDSNVDSMLEGPKSREGVVYDNETQFRFYARWRYLVARTGQRVGE